jgi:Fe-S-cluster containining protein
MASPWIDIVFYDLLPDACQVCARNRATPCCFGDYVFIDPELDAHLMNEAVLMDIGGGVMRYVIPFPETKRCPKLKANNTCSIYSTRPTTCRDFTCLYMYAENKLPWMFAQYPDLVAKGRQWCIDHNIPIKDDGNRDY